VFCPNPKAAVEGEWNGRVDPEAGKKEIEGKYTPTTNDNVRGFVDLVIKVYEPGTVKMPDGKEMNWADGGKLSQYLGGAKVGDKCDISGPWGSNEYKGCGSLKAGSKHFTGLTHIGMMAGGTGITPMLQVLSAILNDPADNTKCSLIYANKTESDILVCPYPFSLNLILFLIFYLVYPVKSCGCRRV
jgi:NAD(P)H-flavin reductase